MAPGRLQDDDDDDPVTAEYDIYLTPQQQEEILLVQYPNRVRSRPYNAAHLAIPEDVRIKPTTGFLEIDINLNTSFNFNKYKGLQWGDALHTAKDVQNASGTYGAAAGFSGAKPRAAGRTSIKQPHDRALQIGNDLSDFNGADAENKVMRVQTLGGRIVRHDGQDVSEEEKGKPMYFVGAFRDDQLHLTKVNGTVQMRPQFHHLDAEEQRSRLHNSRQAATDGAVPPPQGQADARSILSKSKQGEDDLAPQQQKDLQTRKFMQATEAEAWTKLDYVDEDETYAYEKFGERMFLREPEGAVKLESSVDGWEYLNSISAPTRPGAVRRRKRRTKKRRGTNMEEESSGSEGQGEEQGTADAGPEGMAAEDAMAEQQPG